jgi:replication factor A1
MSAQLTPNAVFDLVNETKTPSTFHPTMQVIDIRKVGGGTGDRYRLIISDGEYYAQSMLTTQLNFLIDNESLQKNAIITLDEYICNNVQERKIVVILGVQIVRSNCEKIGSPQAFEKVGNQAPTGSAPSRAPVPPHAHSPQTGFTPVMALNPYQNRWKIKCRIASKAPIKEWSNARGEGKLFSLELVDSSGDDIRCTFFKDAVDKWYKHLEKGKVYTFANGKLKIGNRKWNNCKSEYEISFGTEVQIEGPFEDSVIRSMVYKVKKIASLQNINPETSSLVDVCGIITSHTDMKELTSKAGKELKKRDLTLVDDSGASITVTLWGEKAEIPDSQYQNNPSCLVKGARLGDYGGRSLSTYDSTILLFNSEMPEASALTEWWKRDGQTASFTQLSESRDSVGVDRSGLEWRKTIDAIKRDNMGSIPDGKGGMKPTYLNTKAFITFLKREKWCYPSDPDTMKKLIEPGFPGGKWRNEHEQKDYDEPCWRYIAYMQMGDHTGSHWVNAFGDKAQAIFGGLDANKLKALETSDPIEFRNTFDRLAFKQMNVTLQCKTDSYNDEVRTKVTVFRAEEINFADENKKLCSGIEKYLQIASN